MVPFTTKTTSADSENAWEREMMQSWSKRTIFRD